MRVQGKIVRALVLGAALTATVVISLEIGEWAGNTLWGGIAKKATEFSTTAPAPILIGKTNEADEEANYSPEYQKGYWQGFADGQAINSKLSKKTQSNVVLRKD